MVGIRGKVSNFRKSLKDRYIQWCEEQSERSFEEEYFIRQYKYDPNFPKPKPRVEKVNTGLFLSDVLLDKKRRF